MGARVCVKERDGERGRGRRSESGGGRGTRKGGEAGGVGVEG